MTQDNYTDATDAVDQSVDDSPVIKALRKQIKDLEAITKNAPTRESIEAEVRQELERKSAISTLLIELGHPAGMSAVVNGTLGDAEVSRESVANALRSIGYQVEDADAPVDEGSEPPSQKLADLAKVSDLSSQVRAASQGSSLASEIEKIAQAQSPEELVRLAAEGGWLTQQ